ncbi:uncharacterized protein [Chelonus insularis]|uniref:uncharacterized protein n=1 Tax=Chelonus insularis TaxID=460826 RepID=UPI00158B66BB|nr:uncharacterized protein LOC118072727 [Chelonus insularis]XP_034948716.1 uncharacterized protein LOC118072727 [Chelonus insularis]
MENCDKIDNQRENEPLFLSNKITVFIKIWNDENIENKSCGFHLTRSKWDPYPWISFVETGSIADISGLRAGDCLLEIDGFDIVGLRVKEISSLIKKSRGTVNLQVWRNKIASTTESENENGAAVSGPLPTLAGKLATALSGTIRALECPVCLETASSPVAQCVHGHILCVGCRIKTPKCPVCRVRLGQGRCLLADEIQRNIRDAFEDSLNNMEHSQNASLREKLFGKPRKKLENNQQNLHQTNINTKSKSSFARLFFGGFDKAASVDNLTTPSPEMNDFSSQEPSASYRRLGELFLGDRTKSASTGELSHDKKNKDISSSLFGNSNSGKVYTHSSGYLSVPPTPVWGGSTESMANNYFTCPLASSSHCTVPLNHDNYMEHLGKNHSVIQAHFYELLATIPMPMPFGNDCIYIFHHLSDLFFFQIKDKLAWIVGTGNNGNWILHAWCSNGTEIKFQKSISKIDDSKPESNCSVSLSSELNIVFLTIQIIYSQTESFKL